MQARGTLVAAVAAMAIAVAACGGDDRERDADAGRPDTTEKKPKTAEKGDRGPGSDGHGGY